jgi:hypothetical protein
VLNLFKSIPNRLPLFYYKSNERWEGDLNSRSSEKELAFQASAYGHLSSGLYLLWYTSSKSSISLVHFFKVFHFFGTLLQSLPFLWYSFLFQRKVLTKLCHPSKLEQTGNCLRFLHSLPSDSLSFSFKRFTIKNNHNNLYSSTGGYSEY